MVFGMPSLACAVGLTETIVRSDVPKELTLIVGKTLILKSEVPIKRASLAHPEFADTLVLSPMQLHMTGKAIGTTNLTFWDREGQIFAVYNVEVQADLSALKSRLHALFPQEKNIQVRSSADRITLSGSVSGPEVLSQVLQVAEGFAPQKVMNLIQVVGVRQVMLEVKIAEMQRGLVRRLGFNLARIGSGGDFSIGTLGGLSTFSTDNNGVVNFSVPQAVSAVFGFGIGNDLWQVVLDALKQHNLTKILAEPNLIAVSGQEANFLAGGEFPVPVQQSFGVTTVIFKKFGISLSFSPTVMGNGVISMKIAPEVSELSRAVGITSETITVPGVTTRRAETVVEVRDGQSFAIAGLLQDNITETIAKYPVLGEIPILGALFRSTNFIKNETELVIIITPRLIKPLDMAKQTLPTDNYLEPNDFEFMLMGYVEGVNQSYRRRQPATPVLSGSPVLSDNAPPPIPTGGGLEGQFGHLAR